MNTKDFLKLVYKDVPGEGFLSVDADRCEGCANCVVVCPMLLWKLESGKAKLSREYAAECLECGACWQVCEPGAISFDFPDGGQGIIVKYG